eukprot:5294681-Amphidinium_carterae.1
MRCFHQYLARLADSKRPSSHHVTVRSLGFEIVFSLIVLQSSVKDIKAFGQLSVVCRPQSLDPKQQYIARKAFAV